MRRIAGDSSAAQR